MKRVNIISALSYKEQYELYYWFWITTFLFLITFCVGCYFILPLFHQYKLLRKKTYSLRQKTHPYCELINKKANTQKEYEVQQKKENKVNKYSISIQSLHSYLTMIQKSISVSLQLHYIESKKNECMVHIMGNSTKDIQLFVEQLAVFDKFKHVTLNSLDKKQSNQWFGVIKIQL